jgi:hypothetical protein
VSQKCWNLPITEGRPRVFPVEVGIVELFVGVQGFEVFGEFTRASEVIDVDEGPWGQLSGVVFGSGTHYYRYHVTSLSTSQRHTDSRYNILDSDQILTFDLA